MITFIGAKKKKEQTYDKVSQSVLTNWISFPVAADIIMTDKDSRFLRLGEFSRFRNEGNITLQTAIPGRRQSLGSGERRHMYFKDIKLQIIDKRMNRQTKPVDWQEYASLSMLHLDPQSLQYDGFTPGERVSGRTPRVPIGAAGKPIFFAILRTKMSIRRRRRTKFFRNCEKYKNPL